MSGIKINWMDLGLAFETSLGELEFYLDRETGDVIPITPDIREYAKDPDGADVPDWAQVGAKIAALILAGDDTEQYIPIPPADSSDEYHEMEKFIDTVRHPHVRDELTIAIQGRGAFRRFKLVLSDHEGEQKRWYAYKEARTQERMNEWLAMNDIEVSNPQQAKPVPVSQEPAKPREVENEELIEELTILLLWLCSWQEKITSEISIHRAWKGYPFEVLNALEERGLIEQGRKAKSVTLTEEGIALALELEERLKP